MQHEAELDALRAEVAALRSEVMAVVPRRHLLRGLAGLATAAAVGSIATADPAAAADGDPVHLGESNSSTGPTFLTHTRDPGGPISEAGGFVISSDEKIALSVEQRGAVTGVAIQARADGGYAVVGYNSSPDFPFPAVLGVSETGGPGLGGTSTPDGAQLYLETFAEPQDGQTGTVGPPTQRTNLVGAIKLDVNADLWLCTVSGTPGTWTRVLREDTVAGGAGRTVPIAPLRAIDTRAAGGKPPGSPTVPGQVGGARSGGTSVTLDLAGVVPIPDGATGVVGNVTVASPTFSGFLTVQPAGGSATTSSLNFPKSVAAVANAFTSGLGPAGLKITFSGTGIDKVHLIVDITAYLT